MKNVLGDGIVQQTADCVGVLYGGCENFRFSNFSKFSEFFLFRVKPNFTQISRNFEKFKIISSKFCVSRNFYKFCFAATLCRAGNLLNCSLIIRSFAHHSFAHFAQIK